jgi:ketosteroid isomerase-like protein
MLLFAAGSTLPDAPAAAAAAQDRPARSVQEIIVQLERDWDEAFLRKDVRFIETILADDFVAIYPDGTRGDKAHELAQVAALDQQIDSSTLDGFTVKVNGDTAVVWFTRTLVGPVQGRPTTITYRFLDVFVWRDGRWQCLTSQSTKVLVP